MAKAQLWGARFSKPMNDDLFKMSQSTGFDWRLAPYDILQTMAHVEGLFQEKIISQSQYKKLNAGLDQMLKDLKKGKLLPEADDEDVHSALERILIKRVPSAGAWVRSGRSRNDQIACDLRMYLRDQVRVISRQSVNLLEALTKLGTKHATDPIPGYTHTQRAQPVTLGHQFLSHAQALTRDLGRYQDWDHRASVSPLGAGALAGSGIVKKTQMVASLLAFDDYSLNSLDAVSDRDFVAELLFIISLQGVHLSKIAEEIILFTSKEFGFAKLDDAWGTGSSMMPQKKNADGAELARGKVGRLVGNLTGLLTTLKALPFAYNRDLQEDKEPIFDSVDTILLTLPVIIGMVENMEFDLEKLAAEAGTGFALATEIADFLTLRGIDFKTAHEITGQCVKLAESKGVELAELSLPDLRRINKNLNEELLSVLTVKGSIKNRTSASGTSATSIKAQVRELTKIIKRTKSWANETIFRKLHYA
jgi:argininosuccinate lyase